MRIIYKMVVIVGIVSLLTSLAMGTLAVYSMNYIEDEAVSESESTLLDQERNRMSALAVEKAGHIDRYFIEAMETVRVLNETIHTIRDSSPPESMNGPLQGDIHNFIEGHFRGWIEAGLSGTLSARLNGTFGQELITIDDGWGYSYPIEVTFISGDIDCWANATIEVPEGVFVNGTMDGDPISWTGEVRSVSGRLVSTISGQLAGRDPGCLVRGNIDGRVHGYVSGSFSGMINGSAHCQVLGGIDGRFVGTIDNSTHTIRQALFSTTKENRDAASSYIGFDQSWKMITDANIIFYAPTIGFGGYNFTMRSWYELGKEVGHTVITPPYSSSRPTGLTVTAVEPYSESGSLSSILGMDISLSTVLENLNITGSYRSGRSMIIDREGRLVAIDEMDMTGGDWYSRIQAEDFTRTGNERFKELTQEMMMGGTGIIELDVEWSEGYNETTGEGFRYGPTSSPGEKFVAFAPIRSQGWSLGIIVDRSEVVLPSTELVSTVNSEAERTTTIFVAVSIFCFIISLLMGSFMALRFVSPITTLSKEIEDLDASSLDKRDPSPTRESTDEVAMLSRNFNRMRGRLSASMKELEYEIAEVKSKENELRIERAKAEFYLDLLGHDIGNLHQGIYSAIELASMKRDDPNRLKSSLDMAMENVQRSLALVKNIQVLSRLSHDNKNPIVMDLRQVLKDTTRNIDYLFPTKKVDLTLDIPGEPIPVRAEPMIEYIFFNLLHNAVKYQLGERATVRIDAAVDRRAGVVRTVFEDHGIGISDDIKALLFRRFSRGRASDKKGTGLGLYLVKTLVDRYDGRVMIEDRVPGDHTKGAKFIVEFPLAKKKK